MNTHSSFYMARQTMIYHSPKHIHDKGAPLKR